MHVILQFTQLINMYCLNVKHFKKHLPSELRTDKNKLNTIKDEYKKCTEWTNYEIKLHKSEITQYEQIIIIFNKLRRMLNWPYA